LQIIEAISREKITALKKGTVMKVNLQVGRLKAW
jgi:hypothetical protein